MLQKLTTPITKNGTPAVPSERALLQFLVALPITVLSSAIIIILPDAYRVGWAALNWGNIGIVLAISTGGAGLMALIHYLSARGADPVLTQVETYVAQALEQQAGNYDPEIGRALMALAMQIESSVATVPAPMSSTGETATPVSSPISSSVPTPPMSEKSGMPAASSLTPSPLSASEHEASSTVQALPSALETTEGATDTPVLPLTQPGVTVLPEHATPEQTDAIRNMTTAVIPTITKKRKSSMGSKGGGNGGAAGSSPEASSTDGPSSSAPELPEQKEDPPST